MGSRLGKHFLTGELTVRDLKKLHFKG